MSRYKPYSVEWNRYRYLKEALDTYLDNYVENQVILEDILEILNSRAYLAHKDFEKSNELEWMIRKNAN